MRMSPRSTFRGELWFQFNWQMASSIATRLRVDIEMFCHFVQRKTHLIRSGAATSWAPSWTSWKRSRLRSPPEWCSAAAPKWFCVSAADLSDDLSECAASRRKTRRRAANEIETKNFIYVCRNDYDVMKWLLKLYNKRIGLGSIWRYD